MGWWVGSLAAVLSHVFADKLFCSATHTLRRPGGDEVWGGGGEWEFAFLVALLIIIMDVQTTWQHLPKKKFAGRLINLVDG